MARKDLERVQAEDANYPGLTDALTSLAYLTATVRTHMPLVGRANR